MRLGQVVSRFSTSNNNRIANCLGVQEASKKDKRSSPKQIIQEANEKNLGAESLHGGRIRI